MSYEENENKEKRIAFLSIFSSICRTGQIDTETASKVVDTLFKKYPCEELTQPKTMEVKQKPARCPKCGSMSYYNNKGISSKSGQPYENNKCSKCKHIEWKSMNYEAHRLKDIELKSMGERHQLDDLQDEQFRNEPEAY